MIHGILEDLRWRWAAWKGAGWRPSCKSGAGICVSTNVFQRTLNIGGWGLIAPARLILGFVWFSLSYCVVLSGEIRRVRCNCVGLYSWLFVTLPARGGFTQLVAESSGYSILLLVTYKHPVHAAMHLNRTNYRSVLRASYLVQTYLLLW